MGLLNQFTNGRAVMRAANPSDPGPERIRKLYEAAVRGVSEQRLQEDLDFGRHREVREVLKSGDVPGSPGDRAFAALHKVEVWDDPSMSHDDNERVFRAADIGQSSRSPNYGYRAGEDARRYDALKEGYVSDEELREFEQACPTETELLETIAQMSDQEFDVFVESLSDEERETLRSLLPADTEEEVREQVAAPVSGPRRIMQIMREQKEHEEDVVFPAVAEAVAKQIAASVADGTEPTPQFIHAVALRVLEEHDMGRPALPRFAAWARTLDKDEVKNLMRR